MFSADKMLNVGIPEIDADHKVLDELAREVEKAIISNLPVAEIQNLVAELQSATQSHFDKEERILAPYNLPGMDRHKAAHEGIIDDLSVLLKAIEDNDRDWKDRIFSILGEMTQHIIFYDMEAKGKAVPALDENQIFEAIRQEEFRGALQLWKLSRKRDGVCDPCTCENHTDELTCCACHLQGHMLSLSLTNPGSDFLQLSRTVGKWIDTQTVRNEEPGDITTKRLSIPSSLIIGHPTIDYDHRKLVDIINHISEALEKEEYEECSRLTDRFILIAKGHFKREEQILKETGFPGLASHEKNHEELAGMMPVFVKIAQELGYSELARARLYPELVAFLFDDAVKADLSFKSYLMKLDIVFD